MKIFNIFKNQKEKPQVIYVDSVASKKSSNVLPFVLQIALLYICLVGFVYCITTSLQSEIPFLTVALVALPFIVIAGLFTVNLKLYLVFLGAFVTGSVLVFTFLRDLRDTVVSAFTFAYNRIIQIVVDEGFTSYKSFMTEDITEKLNDFNLLNEYFYCVMFVLIIFFSVIFTASMMKRSMVWLCTLPCFLVLTPSLYFGAVPSGIAFAIFISGILGCYTESISYAMMKRKNKSSVASKKKTANLFVKRISLSGLTNTLIALVISITVSVFVYSSDLLRLDDFRKVIDDIAMHIMNVLFYEQYETAEGAVGGLIEGNTLDLDVPDFRDLPIMDVTTRTNSALYLRGWIGKNLGDEGWNVLNEEDTEQFTSKIPYSFDPYTQYYNFMTLMSTDELTAAETAEDTQKLGFVYDTVDIKAKFNKSLMVFVPMSGINGEIIGKFRGVTKIGDTISFFEGSRPQNNYYSMNAALQSFVSSDFYVSLKQKQNQYLNYAENMSDNLHNPSASELFIINERRYSDYVKETYLATPENSEYFADLAVIASGQGKYSHNFDKALSVERYLKTGFNYSLDKTMVSGTALNKIKYVISESKMGYCTYYASAMTIMMRHLGIPARYVVGYHSKTQQDAGTQKYVRNLIDKNYHAWVEVYIDGIGWLTFDPTPGYGNNTPIRDYEYLDNSEGTSSSEDTPTEPQQQQSAPSQPPEVHEVIEEVPEAAPKDNKILIWGLIVLTVIAVALLIFFVFSFISLRFKNLFKKLRKMNRTLMVRAIYPKLLMLLYALNLKVSKGELITEYARRVDGSLHLKYKLSDLITQLEMSQFSQNEISFQNAKQIYVYFVQLSDIAMKRMNIFKRIYYRIKLINK